MTGTPQPPRALWLVGTLAVATLWLDFSRLHAQHHADSLIPVLVSLQHWTPFFWGQHRFGMLVPLLALPLHNPLHNLLFQGALTIGAGLCCFGLIAGYVAPGRDATAVAAASAALFLGLGPLPEVFNLLVAQPYALSLALGLAGLLALVPRGGRLAPWQVLVATLCTGLAYWVNGTLAVMLVPLMLVRQLLNLAARGRARLVSEGHLRELVVGLLLQGTAQLLSSADLQKHPDGNPYFDTVPAARWPAAWSALIQGVGHQAQGTTWVPQLVIVGLGGVVALLLVKSTISKMQVLGSVLGLVVAAAALVVVLGSNVWVARNAFAPRYMLPAQLFIQVGVVMLWQPVLVRQERVAFVLCSLALGLSLAVRVGLPSPGAPRIAMFSDPRVSILATAHCTHVVGDYWRVWPMVLRVLQARHELADSAPIFGVTTRSEDTQSLWRAVAPAERVVCGPGEDAWALGTAASLLGRPARVVRGPGIFIAQ